MRGKLLKLKEYPALIFIGKTIFYLAILLALVYLYDYTNTNSGNFIYNEF